jgi:hypothetical protein
VDLRVLTRHVVSAMLASAARELSGLGVERVLKEAQVVAVRGVGLLKGVSVVGLRTKECDLCHLGLPCGSR